MSDLPCRVEGEVCEGCPVGVRLETAQNRLEGTQEAAAAIQAQADTWELMLRSSRGVALGEIAAAATDAAFEESDLPGTGAAEKRLERLDKSLQQAEAEHAKLGSPSADALSEIALTLNAHRQAYDRTLDQRDKAAAACSGKGPFAVGTVAVCRTRSVLVWPRH